MLVQMAWNLDSILLVVYVGHLILVEFIVYFWYVFIIPPNYLNKLRKCIKINYFVLDTMFFGVH
jgi:hypothetical protein